MLALAMLGLLSVDLPVCYMPVAGMTPVDAVLRRGCCSRHGGVCGCGGNRARCCDGTLSPSCGC